MGQFDSAAIIGQEKRKAERIHPAKAGQEFTAWCIALILRRFLDLLEELLVLYLTGIQGHSLPRGL